MEYSRKSQAEAGINLIAVSGDRFYSAGDPLAEIE